MTLQDDLEAVHHNVGYYVEFEGIRTKFATHDMALLPGISGDFDVCLIAESISGGNSTLNDELGMIQTSGFSFSVTDTVKADDSDFPRVRDLLRRRGGVEAEMSVAVEEGAIAWAFDGAQPWPINTDVYVDKETVTLNSFVTTFYPTSTRGQYGSKDREHAFGTVVSDVPRHWVGRRCTLYMVFLNTGNVQAVRHGEISQSPSFGNGAWEIQTKDVLDSFLNRPLMTGFQDVEVLSTSTLFQPFDGFTEQVQTIAFQIPDGFQFAVADFEAFVQFNTEEGDLVYRVRPAEYVEGDNEIVVALDDVVAGSFRGTLSDFRDLSMTARQVHIVRDKLSKIVSQVIHSRRGNQVNGTDDVLPGRGQTDDDHDDNTELPALQVGAGIHEDFVDRDSIFDNISDQFATVILDQSEKLGDFLVREILWRAGAFVKTTADGKIGFQRHSTSTIRTDQVALTDSEILPGINSTDNEDGTIAHIKIRSNYDISSRKFLRQVDLVFPEGQHIHGERASTAEFSAKGLWVGETPPRIGRQSIPPTTATLTDLAVLFDRLRFKNNELTRSWRFRLPFTFWSRLLEGQRVRLTSAFAHSHRASVGLSAQTGEVVGRQLNYQTGQMTVDVDEQLAGVVVTPSAAVSTWAGGSLIITLSTAGVWGQGILFDNASPGNDFNDGGEVRIFRIADTPPFSGAPTVATIDAAFGTTIRLTSAPSPAPATGDIVVMANGDDTGDTNDVGADVQDYAFAADATLLVGAGETYERDGPRWG